MIPYGKQDINQEDIDAVVDILTSDFLTQGPRVPEFEAALANYCNVKHCVAVNSATSALHLACLALGLKQGDWLWTSPVTFVASANCARYCGAEVDFVDIDADTYNISVIELEKKLINAEKTGHLPSVLVAVHLTGQPCQMEDIYALSRRFGFKVIEDASHAIGGRYKGKPVGNCQYSDITVFSFHPVKIITTAEGGAAVTKSEQLHKKMLLLRSHGITRDDALMTHESDGPWYYQQIDLGFNYRMTELQAALGVSQLKRIDRFVKRRHELADRYNKLLSSLPIILPWQHPDSYSGLHLYVIRLRLDEISKSHKKVFNELRAAGIGVNLHYIPVHTQPYYKSLGFEYNDFPASIEYYRTAISLPMFHAMTDEQQDRVVQVLRDIVS